MRKFLVPFMLGCFTLLTWAQDGPSLKFEKDTHDFGSIEKGDKKTATFEFQNVGKGVLTIEDVKTSCGCTTATPEKREYQPGEKGAIPVTFDSSRFSNKITKTITVFSNDPENPKYYLKIVGEVESEIEVKPTMISLYNVKREETDREIEISTKKIEKLEISDITSNLPFIKVDSERVNDQTVKLKIKVKGSEAAKDTTTFRGEVKLKTNGSKVPEIAVNVHIKFEEPIRTLPRFISFFGSKSGTQREVTVTLTSTNKETFKIESATTDVASIRVEAPSDAKDQHQVKVILGDSAEKGKFQGFLTVKTNMADMPEIRLPIRGSVL
jgi:hypothetical protein